jgi:DNA-binding NarL/FixJ family response regulator
VIQQTRPDVVLLDVHLPGGNGAAVIAGLPETPARFLAFSVSDLAEDVIEVISSRLSISVKTVESHASAVLRKLQLSNRKELSRWAAERRRV